MKKLALITLSLLAITSCSTTEEKENIHSPGGNPLPPNRGFNMESVILLTFLTNEGINIFDPQNPIVDEKDIDVDIYGVNGYEDEYPYSIAYNNEKFIRFQEDDTYSLLLLDYGYKSNEIQKAFGERGWYKYKITFPDNTIYEVKVEGVLYRTGIDYGMYKIYINNELKWIRTNNEDAKLTIVK